MSTDFLNSSFLQPNTNFLLPNFYFLLPNNSENFGQCRKLLIDEQKYNEHVEIKEKDKKNMRDFVDNFPTNFLKRITFLHPMGVYGWTFHCTAKQF